MDLPDTLLTIANQWRSVADRFLNILDKWVHHECAKETLVVANTIDLDIETEEKKRGPCEECRFLLCCYPSIQQLQLNNGPCELFQRKP